MSSFVDGEGDSRRQAITGILKQLGQPGVNTSLHFSTLLSQLMGLLEQLSPTEARNFDLEAVIKALVPCCLPHPT
ncbi:hypothetical protein KIPB_012500, partial [Kipferlia bialata]|eukprot:g12500.t1